MTSHTAPAPPDAHVAQVDWVRHYYEVVDAMDMQTFLPLHTEDCLLVFGNNPPVVGQHAIAEVIAELWNSLDLLRHNPQRVWDLEESAIVEALIDYRRLDGHAVTLPCTSILHQRSHKIDDLRIYMDISPLFAQTHEMRH
jgi:ketosteroid isomerase-like protein